MRHRPNPRKKKNLPQTRVFFTSCFVNGPRESNLAESAFKILSVKFKFSFFLLDLLAFECYTRIFADISETRRLQAISFFGDLRRAEHLKRLRRLKASGNLRELSGINLQRLQKTRGNEKLEAA